MTMKRLGLVLASGTIAVLLVELVLWLPFYTPHALVWQAGSSYRLDPELIYSHRPGTQGSWSNDEFTERRRINGAGLRGEEVRPEGTFDKRILVLGDSLVFGHGVGDADSFPARLEAIFRERGQRVEVLNGGVPGYGTDQSYQSFALRLRRLKPDLLIFAIYVNDLDDNIRQPLFTIDGDRLVPIDARKTWLYLAGLIETSKLGPLKRTRVYDLLQSSLAGRDPFSLLPFREQSQLLQWSKRKVLLEIESLRRMSDEDGFDLLVLGMPHPDLHGYEWWSEIEGLDVWSLDSSREPLWRERPELFFKDAHLRPAGNQALAELVEASLPGHLGFPPAERR
jgi:lysophospholipase L1-like esterase